MTVQDGRTPAEMALMACVSFMSNEMGWEFFRAEQLYEDGSEPQSVSKSNAKKLQKYLHDLYEENPELRQLISEARQ